MKHWILRNIKTDEILPFSDLNYASYKRDSKKIVYHANMYFSNIISPRIMFLFSKKKN